MTAITPQNPKAISVIQLTVIFSNIRTNTDYGFPEQLPCAALTMFILSSIISVIEKQVCRSAREIPAGLHRKSGHCRQGRVMLR